MKEEIRVNTLFIDDDEEYIELYRKDPTSEISKGNFKYKFKWSFISSFNEALKEIKLGKYDLVVTDLRNEQKETTIENEEIKEGKDVLNLIRAEKFFPVIAFTSGSCPDYLKESPFLKFADKMNLKDEIKKRLHEIIKTEILRVSWQLHADLNRAGNLSLWGFIENNWESLMDNYKNLPEKENKMFSFLEGLIRKRAVLQLRLESSSSSIPPSDATTKIEIVEGHQYYIYKNDQIEGFSLGQILKPKKRGDPFRLVLTPTCHLIPRNGKSKADLVLTIEAKPAEDPTQKPILDKPDKLKKATRIPVRGLHGVPEGRYCFLPKFLEIPNLYLDFLSVMSLKQEDINKAYEPLAILDSPYAEAVQAAFTSFYSSVGLPELNTENCEGRIVSPETPISKKN